MCVVDLDIYEEVAQERDELEEKLTKAKEIIRKYLEWANWKGSNCPSFDDICKQAEAFLKE